MCRAVLCQHLLQKRIDGACGLAAAEDDDVLACIGWWEVQARAVAHTAVVAATGQKAGGHTERQAVEPGASHRLHVGSLRHHGGGLPLRALLVELFGFFVYIAPGAYHSQDEGRDDAKERGSEGVQITACRAAVADASGAGLYVPAQPNSKPCTEGKARLCKPDHAGNTAPYFDALRLIVTVIGSHELLTCAVVRLGGGWGRCAHVKQRTIIGAG